MFLIKNEKVLTVLTLARWLKECIKADLFGWALAVLTPSLHESSSAHSVQKWIFQLLPSCYFYIVIKDLSILFQKMVYIGSSEHLPSYVLQLVFKNSNWILLNGFVKILWKCHYIILPLEHMLLPCLLLHSFFNRTML